MRPLFALIILLTLSSALQAQTLVKENKLWACTRAGSEQPENYESYFIKFSGDSIIDGIEYKKVWRSNDSLQTNWYIDGYIREDSLQRIFFYPINREYAISENEEILIYDFSLEEGDTIWSNTGEFYAMVESVSYLHLNGFDDSLKKIVVRDEYYAWIEEIGSMNGILRGLNIIHLVGAYFNLTCYFENDTLKFQNPEFSTCFPKGLNNVVSELKIQSIKVNPYISGNNLVFDIENVPMHKTTIQIFSCLGNLVYEKQFLNENRLEIPIKEFQNGIYIYRLEVDINSLSGKIAITK